jgi:hypothetical protein
MDISRYLQSHPELDLTGSGKEQRGTCPFHSSPRGQVTNFAINTETGYWLCRSPACGLKGSFPLFYKLLERIENWADVRARLDRSLPIRNWEELLSFQSKQDRVASIRYQELPSEIFQQPISAQNFPTYLRGRGYNESLLDLGYDLRLCSGGEYRGRILLPFYDLQGQLLTFTARLMDDSSQDDRYRFPEGATTNQFLYGVHRINSFRKVPTLYVCEGQFDVIRLATLGEMAVGISKGIISDRQLLDVKRICQLYTCSATVCLDRGAFAGTQKIWSELCSLGVEAQYVDISPIAKDPGELDVDSLRALRERVLGSSRLHLRNFQQD